jgi:tRNA-2-methylthio-N6-dimethylallyladenosine synthase
MLAAMDRGYTVEEYLRLVERLRASIPNLALSTDIIVGFHGEERDDYEQTLALMRTVGYDQAFTFKYSVRENTRAYKLGDSISEEEKSSRLAAVIALQEATSLERNRAIIGQTFPVLVEGPARRGEGMLSGKTPQFKTAIFPDRGASLGETIDVRVESATAHTLICQPCL